MSLQEIVIFKMSMFFYQWLVNIEWSVEPWSRGVSNTKMNTEIYTGLGHRSIISYVQCGWISTLLILVSSIEEFVTGVL
jgi:hypothetical protein